MRHCYPDELALFVREQWDAPCSFLEHLGGVKLESTDPLPDLDVLEELISICYQASLLRSEERPIRFRLILQDPDLFYPDQGPPDGLHRLIFTEPRPCNENELRRLSPSTDFYHSLIGVALNPDRGLLIWGLIHSGPRWIQSLYGGGKTFRPLPASLVIHVTSPGRIAVCKGSVTVATLNAGQIMCPSIDVFDARWLKTSFDASRAYVWDLHMLAKNEAEKPWARIDPDLLRVIKKQVMMRVISKMRSTHHGGTIITLPQELVPEFSTDNDYMTIKYRFQEEEPRERFGTLLLELINTLAAAYGRQGSSEKVVGWSEYLASKNQNLSRLDEAIFEWAHLVAGLSEVDGAVVMTRRFELLGFGGEISGKLGRVPAVLKALDPEGDQYEPESTAGVGTRHHSAYRLCNVLHHIIAVVVSQDGTVQFVKWKDGSVICWDQVATSFMDV
jgi:hypothetical protein